MTDRQRERYETIYKPAYDTFVKLYPFDLENLEGEIWKDIPGYEGYQVSTFGRVKSFKKNKPRILKPVVDNGGYLHLALSKDSKTKYFRVHQLVALTFMPNPKNLPEVDHCWGVKFDNSVENLRWVTREQNMQAAFELGLNKVKSGEEHHNAKLTSEQIVFICENPDGLTQGQFAEKYDIDVTVISCIQLGKTYKNSPGKIRKAQRRVRLPEEIRAKVRAEYVYESKEFGSCALAKKYGVDHSTILNIIHEANQLPS